VVVVVGLTDMEFPVPAEVPPQLAVYQLKVAPVPNDPPLWVSVELPPVQ
jgi:hypothetical protein